MPAIVDRATWQAEIDALRVREKAHTREGDAIAAARRRLPMVEVDSSTPLVGPHGPVTLLDAFEGRRQLIAYYFMWHTGHSAPEQCEGCTWCTTHVAELAYLHSRDITYAVFMPGPVRREQSLPRLHGLGHAVVLSAGVTGHIARRAPGRRDAHRVLPAGRRPRLRDLLDELPRCRGDGLQLRPHGPHGVWPPGGVGRLTGRLADTPDRQQTRTMRSNGRPIAQWSRLEAGRSDDLAPK